MARRIHWLFWLCLLVNATLTGCKTGEELDYSRQLGDGEHALVRIDEWEHKPALAQSYTPGDPDLIAAVDRSIQWFSRPSTLQWFPVAVAGGEPVTHDRALASLQAMKYLLQHSRSGHDFEQNVYREFEVFQSVGYDREGSVLYTGYYAPTFDASRTPGNGFNYPLYRRPPDLVTDPTTGETLGRQVGQTTLPYPSRQEIEQSGMLRGLELVYLRSKFDVYLVQVQGSAQLRMSDGSVMHIGYAGTNGHAYVSVARALAAAGKLDENRLSLPAMRAYFDANPQEVDRYLQINPRYVFFQQYPGDNWPAGSLGFKVAPMRSLATDKSAFPRGGIVLVHTMVPTGTGTGDRRVFTQLMLDQDTGGAIRAAGRADIFMGIGDAAERIAGNQYATGYLFYYFLKPERVDYWLGGGGSGG